MWFHGRSIALPQKENNTEPSRGEIRNAAATEIQRIHRGNLSRRGITAESRQIRELKNKLEIAIDAKERMWRLCQDDDVAYQRTINNYKAEALKDAQLAEARVARMLKDALQFEDDICRIRMVLNDVLNDPKKHLNDRAESSIKRILLATGDKEERAEAVRMYPDLY